RGLARKRARGVWHPVLHDARAARAAGRSVRGDPVALDTAPQWFHWPLLPTLGRTARSQAGPEAVSGTDDRGRRRTRHSAHCRETRESLECLGWAEGPGAEEYDPRRALCQNR